MHLSTEAAGDGMWPTFNVLIAVLSCKSTMKGLLCSAMSFLSLLVLGQRLWSSTATVALWAALWFRPSPGAGRANTGFSPALVPRQLCCRTQTGAVLHRGHCCQDGTGRVCLFIFCLGQLAVAACFLPWGLAISSSVFQGYSPNSFAHAPSTVLIPPLMGENCCS